MPYGSNIQTGDASIVKYQLFTPGGVGYSYITNRDGYENSRLEWLRSGGMAPKQAVKTARQPIQWVYEKKKVTIFNGPKLPYQVRIYSHRLKKDVWVRARAPIVLEKMVKVRPVGSPKKKGKRRNSLDLPPNNLVFYQNKVTGGTEVLTLSAPHTSVPGFERRITANLLYPGAWPGGSFPIPPYLFVHDRIGNQYGARWNSAVSETDYKALNALYGKIKDMDVNIGQFLAESRQTATLIADTAVRIAKFLHDCKTGNLGRAFSGLFPKSPAQLASEVLAIQYGVRPLLQDIDGMMKSLAKGQRKDYFDIVVRRSIEIPPKIEDTATTGQPKGTTVLTCSGSVTTVYKVRIRLENRDLNGLVTNGTLNIPAIGWELLPYSFVLDWFIPIGNFLSNLDSLVGLTVLSCHKTTVSKRHSVIRRTFGGVDGDDYRWEFGTAEASFDQVEVIRTVLPTVPEIPYPQFKNPLGPDHILNALALITSYRR